MSNPYDEFISWRGGRLFGGCLGGLLWMAGVISVIALAGFILLGGLN